MIGPLNAVNQSSKEELLVAQPTINPAQPPSLIQRPLSPSPPSSSGTPTLTNASSSPHPGNGDPTTLSALENIKVLVQSPPLTAATLATSSPPNSTTVSIAPSPSHSISLQSIQASSSLPSLSGRAPHTVLADSSPFFYGQAQPGSPHAVLTQGSPSFHSLPVTLSTTGQSSPSSSPPTTAAAASDHGHDPLLLTTGPPSPYRASITHPQQRPLMPGYEAYQQQEHVMAALAAAAAAAGPGAQSMQPPTMTGNAANDHQILEYLTLLSAQNLSQQQHQYSTSASVSLGTFSPSTASTAAPQQPAMGIPLQPMQSTLSTPKHYSLNKALPTAPSTTTIGSDMPSHHNAATLIPGTSTTTLLPGKATAAATSASAGEGGGGESLTKNHHALTATTLPSSKRPLYKNPWLYVVLILVVAVGVVIGVVVPKGSNGGGGASGGGTSPDPVCTSQCAATAASCISQAQTSCESFKTCVEKCDQDSNVFCMSGCMLSGCLQQCQVQANECIQKCPSK